MTHHDYDEWRPIQRGATRRRLMEASLVLTAVDVTHVVIRDEHDWCIKVPSAEAQSAIAHLEKYRLENQPPPAAPAPDQIDNGLIGVLGFLVVIWSIPFFENSGFLGWNWRVLGRVEAGAVMDGEWWRTITALTLHGDLGHIIGNSAFGAVFGLFAGRFMGSGLAWLLILLGGALGNLVAAALRPAEFMSLGASTATFAALSLSSAFVWRRGYFQGRGWRRAFAPLFAAIALLSFTGVGGERTDVLAHFTGFLAGLGLGYFAANWPIRRLGRIGQKLCGFAALGLVLLAWSLAGSAGVVATHP